MPAKSQIVDPSTGRSAVVSTQYALCVTPIEPDLPPGKLKNRYTVYSALVGSAGAVETGLTNANMNVDGSVTPQIFYVGAEADIDIRVMRIIITIADSAVTHNSFGNVAALTNGFSLDVMERGLVTSLISAAKTGGQVIAQSGLASPYGDGAQSWELLNWTGTEDAQVVAMDITSLVPGGIRIARGTESVLCATVNDDLTGLSEFTVRVMGYRHHE